MSGIAFVNATGDLFIVDGDGSGIRMLTGGTQAAAGSAGAIVAQPLDLGTYHTWPTWSPDGTKIAVSRVRTGNQGTRITLQVIDTDTSSATTAYDNRLQGMVAQGAPHYMYWSPNSRYLAFLASTAEGLTFFVKDTSSSDPAIPVETGAPLYWHWATDSSALLLHVRDEIKLMSEPFDGPSRVLVPSTSPFRVPALSPDGERFAYIQSDRAQAGLFVAPVDDPDDATKLLDVGPLSALAWSPDGTQIAVADQQDSRGAVFQELKIVSSRDGSQVRTISQGAFVSFFWAPKGQRIAWVNVDLDARAFRWMVSDATGDNAARELFQFQPSTDLFTMLSFFDQYGYSNSLWSPDGNSLVVAGTLEAAPANRNGQTPTGDRVFVLDASGQEPPNNIVGGTLAFWSWN